MAWLMLTQSAVMARTSRRLIPERHRQTVTDISRQAASAVSGYMIGNLLISLCAGVAALIFLLIAGVPNPVVLALWVAFADLIPLVGAVLGAVVAVFAALLVSPGVGIAAIVFFLIYQQFENSVLQTQIMARTVKVNPLAVLVSVLLGVALFGFVGALLAIPLAGAISVVIKEVWRYRRALGEPPPSLSERGIVLVVPEVSGALSTGDELDDDEPADDE
jgi:predicted PurR-regulated permease PerM